MANKVETVVMVPCPRCGGQGACEHWMPDNGVCYLCKGKRALEVNVERGERHLYVLRQQYKAAREAGDTERMEYLARKGSMKKDLVEAAKAVAGGSR